MGKKSIPSFFCLLPFRMRNIAFGLILVLAIFTVSVSSAFAADGPTWRTGHAKFSSPVTSPNFVIDIVPNTKTGSNYIDIDYTCPSSTKYKVELFTAAGVLADSVSVSCKYVGVAYWLNNYKTGYHHLKFTRTAGSGTITISKYRYHYVRFNA